MTIHARPNLNGNTRTDFVEAYMSLTKAKDALDASYRTLNENVLNGRNYQHLSDSDEKIILDRRIVHEKMRKISGLMGEIQSGLSDILIGTD